MELVFVKRRMQPKTLIDKEGRVSKSETEVIPDNDQWGNPQWDAAEYHGKQVSVGGGTYDVVREGSRWVVRDIPDHLGHLLGPVGFKPSNQTRITPSTAQMVEVAAKKAIEDVRKEGAAKRPEA